MLIGDWTQSKNQIVNISTLFNITRVRRNDQSIGCASYELKKEAWVRVGVWAISFQLPLVLKFNMCIKQIETNQLIKSSILQAMISSIIDYTCHAFLLPALWAAHTSHAYSMLPQRCPPEEYMEYMSDKLPLAKCTCQTEHEDAV